MARYRTDTRWTSPSSRARQQPLTSWSGHHELTAAALHRIISRAGVGVRRFTSRERLLCAVCEFWSAVQARDLLWHVGSEPCSALVDASVAFNAIGALDVGHRINAAISHARNHSSGSFDLLQAAGLERSLVQTVDPVDELIARFAATIGRDDEDEYPVGSARGHSAPLRT